MISVVTWPPHSSGARGTFLVEWHQIAAFGSGTITRAEAHTRHDPELP